MSTSRLINAIESYDPYAENRLNGFKAVYLFILLCAFYFFCNINEPYFYYFYVPLTAFAAELLGATLKKKFLFLALAIGGSAISIFLFNLLSTYKMMLVIFVFFYSLSIYFYVIHKKYDLFAIVAIILSLAAYSLLYAKTNTDLITATNHFLVSIVAGLVLMVGLWLFPKKYYFRIWRRAFLMTLQELDNIAAILLTDEETSLPVCTGLTMMQRYVHLLSPKMPCYSVLKITLLMFDLSMNNAYLISFRQNIHIDIINRYRHYVQRLITSCSENKMVQLGQHEIECLHETYSLLMIKKIIHSWNYLCQDARLNLH